MATEKSSTVNTKPNLTLVKPVSDFMDTAWSMETDLDVLNAMLCIGSSDAFHEKEKYPVQKPTEKPSQP